MSFRRSTRARIRSKTLFVSARGGAVRRLFESAPEVAFEGDWEGERTLVPHFDVEAFARVTSHVEEEPWGMGNGPGSGVRPSGARPSLPTLPCDVGALVNEPEEDTLLRLLGGGKRSFRLCIPRANVAHHRLGPAHGYVLDLLDGKMALDDVLAITALARLETLRAIEALAQLGIVA
jgi:hypothetical protein